jgi:catechol 2,3-dioxygenase-like lactoylglutathione lyase family enzyme
VSGPLLRKVDAVTVPVPDLEAGLGFYRDQLGHALLWRHDEIGQAGLRLPDTDTELVLTTELDYAATWLVAGVEEAAGAMLAGGGRMVSDPSEIPVGRTAVVSDPFGNPLVLIELKGRYATDDDGRVTGVDPTTDR